MKKLFATTALFSAVALVSAAHAAGPNVTLGGFINVQGGFSDQDNAFETGTHSREVKFRNDTEVHVNVEGAADNGLKYGAVIELEADITADDRGEGLNADKTYLWLESDAGRTELGNNESASAAMAVNAASLARATGGIDGDDEFYINATGLGGSAAFLIHPDLPEADRGGATEDAGKISYYTPSFSGFQLGASYTPDDGNGGTASGFTTDSDAGDFENVFSLGASFAGDVEGFGIETALVGEFGESETAGTEDLAAWQLGLMLSHEESGLSVAGSYGDWGDSGLATGSSSGLDADFWTAGVGYENGPVGLSLTYLDSERERNEFNNIVVGADYQLAPGLVPYVEVSFFDADEDAVSTDNDGTVILIGSYLNF